MDPIYYHPGLRPAEVTCVSPSTEFWPVRMLRLYRKINAYYWIVSSNFTAPYKIRHQITQIKQAKMNNWGALTCVVAICLIITTEYDPHWMPHSILNNPARRVVKPTNQWTGIFGIYSQDSEFMAGICCNLFNSGNIITQSFFLSVGEWGFLSDDRNPCILSLTSTSFPIIVCHERQDLHEVRWQFI